MKTILIATDFSPASDDASLYGAELAMSFHAEVILYSAYQVPVPSPESSIVIAPQVIRQRVEKQLYDKANSIKETFDVQVHTVCEEEPTALGILRVAAEKTADIIVVGMKTSGKIFRQLFGSTVTCLARMTRIPLVVVPEGTVYTKPISIALAYETDLERGADTHFLDSICETAEKFQSSLYFVKVVKDKTTEQFRQLPLPFGLSKAIRSFETKYEFLQGKQVASTLNEFIRHRKIDMVAMLPHRHSFLEGWPVKSNTRSMIFESPIPILLLPESRQGQNIEHEAALQPTL